MVTDGQLVLYVVGIILITVDGLLTDFHARYVPDTLDGFIRRYGRRPTIVFTRLGAATGLTMLLFISTFGLTLMVLGFSMILLLTGASYSIGHNQIVESIVQHHSEADFRGNSGEGR